MSLLFPLYILGAAAVALPILLHRRRQRPDKRTQFSTLMFLDPTPPRVKTRSRLENLLLLLLRCLAFLLLALCFARPFLPIQGDLAGSGGGGRVLLLVDTSASMRREGLLESLRQQFADRLSGLGGRDRIAILTYDSKVQHLVEFNECAHLDPKARDELLIERLATVEPGWGGSNLAHALMAATEAIAEDEARPGVNSMQGGEVILFGDLQAGSELDALNTFEWPGNVSVSLEPVQSRAASNAGLLLAAAQDAAGAGKDAVRVRIWNAVDSDTEKFRLRWDGADAEGPVIYVPAGKSRVVQAPERPALGASKLLLSGDGHAFDNGLHIAPELPRQLTIAYLGSRPETGPQGALYYLERVFQPNRQLTPRLNALEELPPPDEFRPEDLHLVIAESPVAQRNINSLKYYLEGGRTLLYFLNDVADLGALSQLCSVEDELPPPTSPSAGEGGEYQLIEAMDTRHPVLAPFAEPRFRDFTKVHFWKHRKWPEGWYAEESVIARFDNGAAALVELPAGNGSVLVLLSSFRPEDSQLAVSTKFVPLLFSILEHSAGSLSRTSRFATGEPVPLPQVPRPVAVVRPDGQRIKIKPNQDVFEHTEDPGIYRLETSEAELTFAVNLPPSESRTAPMDPGQLAQLGVVFEGHNPSDNDVKKSQKPFAEIENQQKIWKWLLAAACVFFLLETWLAGRLTRPLVAQGS